MQHNGEKQATHLPRNNASFNKNE